MSFDTIRRGRDNGMAKKILQLPKGRQQQFPRARVRFGSMPQVQDAVVTLFENAGFVVGSQRYSDDRGYDIVAERKELGGMLRYLVQIKVWKRPLSASAVREEIGILEHQKQFSELWIVAQAFTHSAVEVSREYARVRLLTLEQLKEALASPRPKKRAKPRTAIGKAIRVNEVALATTIAALAVSIDERLEALAKERPNSHEATSNRDATIAQYKRLRSELVALKKATAKFNAGDANEAEVVRTSKSFSDGVRKWWNSSHEKILDKAYDMGLFALAVGVCSLAGSGGQMAVAVSAALVGGKPVADALKGIGKKFGGLSG